MDPVTTYRQGSRGLYECSFLMINLQSEDSQGLTHRYKLTVSDIFLLSFSHVLNSLLRFWCIFSCTRV